MGLILDLIEGIFSLWSWFKGSTAEKLGKVEQKNVELTDNNEIIKKQLSDAVNPPNSLDRLRDKQF